MKIQESSTLLSKAKRLLIITGAGMSADSGIPTFRDNGGLWKNYDPQKMASTEALNENIDELWDWYRERRLQIASCEPHQGHRAISLLQQYFSGETFLCTTNEDDLLERAEAKSVMHLHGSIFETSCVDECGWSGIDDCDNHLSFLPCPKCGANTRPGSVLYGEFLSEKKLQKIVEFKADACLIIGSSSIVQPIASIAPDMAIEGKLVVEINTRETQLSSLATVSIRGAANDVLPVLIDSTTSKKIRNLRKESEGLL